MIIACSEVSHSGRARAFTRTDLLVLLAVAALLAALLTLTLRRMREHAGLQLCESNLGQVARAVTLYTDDHAATLPGPVPGQPGDFWWWYKEQVKSYAGLTGPPSARDLIFACPFDRGYSDPRPFRSSGRFAYGSYVFNGVTLYGTPNIAGWKVSEVKQPKRTLLVMEWTAHAPLSWHRSRTGRANAPFYSDAESVVAFVDGHARSTPIYYDGYNAAYTRDPIAGYEYEYSGN